MLYSQIKPLLIFCFILACIHVTEALKGDKVLKAKSDSLLTYMRFGFLKGGTIDKELSLVKFLFFFFYNNVYYSTNLRLD